MNFQANDDLALFLDAVSRIQQRYRSAWTPGQQRWERSAALEAELLDGGFLVCAQEPTLGVLAATAMVYELAQLPVCVELAAATLIQPWLCPDATLPLAVIWGDAARPTRHLPGAHTVLHLGPEVVRLAPLRAPDVQAVDSVFAYPMGQLQSAATLPWTALDADLRPRLQTLWRLGLAAELLGCLQAGLDAVVAHVQERRQFGRPLGSFQGIQHRLASAASAIQGGRWLTLQAAYTESAADAACAAGYAQSMATAIVYDLHQFMGAMGLTLEHPLHRWTYRVKLLRTDLGGAEQQLQQLAQLSWPPHD